MLFVLENWNWLWCPLRALMYFYLCRASFLNSLCSAWVYILCMCVLPISVWVPHGCSSSSVSPCVTLRTACLSPVCVQPTRALTWVGCFCVLSALPVFTWLLCYLNAIASPVICACHTCIGVRWVSCVPPLCVHAAAVCYFCVLPTCSLCVPPPRYLCLLLRVLTFSHAPIYGICFF